MPDRIQLSRAKGWRLPEGAMSVARPTMWGNPFTVAGAIEFGFATTEPEGRKVAADRFREWFLRLDRTDSDVVYHAHGRRYDRRWMSRHLDELRGKHLACWCPPGEPCHVDFLLEVANA